MKKRFLILSQPPLHLNSGEHVEHIFLAFSQSFTSGTKLSFTSRHTTRPISQHNPSSISFSRRGQYVIKSLVIFNHLHFTDVYFIFFIISSNLSQKHHRKKSAITRLRVFSFFRQGQRLTLFTPHFAAMPESGSFFTHSLCYNEEKGGK